MAGKKEHGFSPQKTIVSLRLRLLSYDDGHIFFIGKNSLTSPFLSLSMRNGSLDFHFKLLKGNKKITFKKRNLRYILVIFNGVVT